MLLSQVIQDVTDTEMPLLLKRYFYETTNLSNGAIYRVVSGAQNGILVCIWYL